MATNGAAAAAPSPPAPPALEDGDGGVLLSLNVRTIDQRTFPVSVRSGASVPQLKEAVALETGVTLARQRLIFRGRVLKNDQKIAAYSLEDGHTLHLVVRADPPAVAPPSPAPAAATAPTTTGPTTASSEAEGARMSTRAARRSARFLRAISRGQRDNDEPDPTLAGGPPGNRVLMGATITVPEGADVNMPFLSSMIANIMTSVQDSVAGNGETAEPGRRRVSWGDELRPGSRHRSRSSGRSRRDRSDPASNPRAGASAAAATAGGAAAAAATAQPAEGQSRPTHVDRQASLRSRTALRLDNIQETLGNAEFDFRGIDHAQVDPAVNSDAAAFQAQLDQFATLISQFGTRMQLLPVALSDRDRLQDQTLESQFPLTRPIVRAIETLQTIGESADLLSRTARHLFLRQSSRTIGEFHRLSEIRRSRVAAAAARFGAATTAAAEGGASASTNAAASATPAQGAAPAQDAAASSTESATTETAAVQDEGLPQPPPGMFLPPFLDRFFAGSRGFPVDLTGTSVHRPGASTSAASGGTPGPARAHGTSHVSFGGMGLPLASVVFPISLTGANNASTTWNFADFLSRLVGEIPSSTLYGLLTGDPISVHQVMAHVGFALVSGVDVPQVTRAGIRTWSSSFVGELRQQLQTHGIPSAVLSEVDTARRSSFVDDLVRPLEPFVPELVDYFFRATSASRAASFGTRSAAFLSTMSRQFVTSLSSSFGNDTDRLGRMLRQLLVCLGMQENLAGFAVDSFIEWTTEPREAGSEAAPSSSSRRRQRSTTTDPSASEPGVKRQRRS